jgi:hypothetical protein
MAIDSSAGLITQYEDLRGHAVAHSTGVRSLGYALFTRQGMVAWARAWHSCASELPTSTFASVEHNPMPVDLRAQVALVLAGIIFNLQRQEVCPC